MKQAPFALVGRVVRYDCSSHATIVAGTEKHGYPQVFVRLAGKGAFQNVLELTNSNRQDMQFAASWCLDGNGSLLILRSTFGSPQRAVAHSVSGQTKTTTVLPVVEQTLLRIELTSLAIETWEPDPGGTWFVSELLGAEANKLVCIVGLRPSTGPGHVKYQVATVDWKGTKCALIDEIEDYV